MAEYEDREHYIPLRKSDLIALLCRDKQLPRDQVEDFKQFCTLISSVFHFEYLEKLEELKEGEQVTVRTEKREGHLVAAEIQTGSATSAAMPPPAPPENKRIEKIRQAHKIADWFLQQMEEQKNAEPK